MEDCFVKYTIVGNSFSKPYKIKNKTVEGDVWRFDLDKEGKSWVDVFRLPEHLMPNEKEFEKIWKLKPEEKGTVIMWGKEVQTPRWVQGYIKNNDFPKEFLPYLNHINSTNYTKKVREGEKTKFNEAYVNWYLDGSNYIGPHVDKIQRLVKGPNKEVIVYSLTLQEKNTSRTFRLKPIKGGKDRLDIMAEHGFVMIMGGQCQNTHKHQVPKISDKKAKDYGRRINITFRMS